MKNFPIPTKEQVSPANQTIFDNLNGMVGFVPNLYAIFAHSDTALSDYLALQNRKSSIRAKEREVINLVVSQVNNCSYCLSAHTQFAKMNGFTDEQILDIRRANISFDPKLDALAKLVKSTTENRGHASAEVLENFFAAGYTESNLIDVVIIIGDKIITNYLHALTDIPVDWPLAPELEAAAV
ncbi:carboxymuconolactone decarboxylase family protein [Mucilaginibacter daejeonensis]|uniref:carboxymuconolactone decarboxylase family protein n=1 Tax=Mucilaginibacter daejeonensis TaxID=398049 RepID=UPI001D179E6A|nr:carboxymuconolactone decarboxylase family protein [Mucilaginibacter daejeonensis]UEG54858.1 carboxymuconolactone decarboxylase family protein [Mucilaginibacter daejeonensis]